MFQKEIHWHLLLIQLFLYIIDQMQVCNQKGVFMIKKAAIGILAVCAIIACTSQATKEAATVISLSELTAQTGDFVGKTVQVTGTVGHVCKHGGKRMFFAGETPEQRFKITTGEAVEVFDVALEGSEVEVVGIVEELRVDEDYLDNWETNATGGEDQSHAEVEHHHQDTLDQINALREQLAESEKEYLSFYSIKCVSLKEL